MSLTIKEFRGLPRAQKIERYAELSNHDKFLARMEDWGGPDLAGDQTEWDPTEKEIEALADRFNGK